MEKINPTGRCANLTDEKLFSLCKMFGAQALEARRKFLGLLPEVNRRELAEKLHGKSWLARRGFPDIFVFAKKLAGASEEQVRIVLNLERRFEDKPVLQSMLINGEVSANKLARVVSIATKENQKALAEQVRILPNRAIEVLVRDVKNEQNILQKSDDNAPQTITSNCLQEPLIKNTGLHVQTSGGKKAVTPGELLSMKMNLKLDSDIIVEMNELQGKGININEILREVLNKRRNEIAGEKAELAEIERGKRQDMVTKDDKHSAPDDSNTGVGEPVRKPLSRYISVRVKKVLAAEHGNKCSIQNCRRDAEEIHHTQRFAMAQSHNPHFLAPLCKEHHLIAHCVDGTFWRRRT
jgi:hypothetical protein